MQLSGNPQRFGSGLAVKSLVVGFGDVEAFP
jgi:hypothetical protein